MLTRRTTFSLLFIGLAFSACEPEPIVPAATTFTLNAALSGKQAADVNNSPASGTLTGTYDVTTRTLSYTVTYQSLTPLTGHIHQGVAGRNGPLIVSLPAGAPSPVSGTIVLSEADGQQIVNNATYVDFHTSAYPTGEIRGNITVK